MSINSLQTLSEFFILLSTNKSTITDKNLLSLYQFINNKLKIITRLSSIFKERFPNTLNLNELFENHKTNMNNFINDFLKFLDVNSIIKINLSENNETKNDILIDQKSKNKIGLQIQNNNDSIIYTDLLANNKINSFEIYPNTFINFFNESGNEKYLTIIDLFLKTSKYLMKNKLIYKKVKILNSKDDFNVISQNLIYKKRPKITINLFRKSFLTPPKIKKKFLNKNFLMNFVSIENKTERKIPLSPNDSIEDISDIETMRIQVPHNTNFSRKEKIKKPKINIEKYLNNISKKNPTAQKIKKSNIARSKFMELNTEGYSENKEMLSEGKKCKTFGNMKHFYKASNIIKIGNNIKKDYKHSTNIYDFYIGKNEYKIKNKFNINSSMDDNIVENKGNEQCNIY